MQQITETITQGYIIGNQIFEIRTENEVRLILRFNAWGSTLSELFNKIFEFYDGYFRISAGRNHFEYIYKRSPPRIMINLNKQASDSLFDGQITLSS